MSSNQIEMNSADGGPPGSSASAGALLREARLAAGVHIESIAFSLKVPVSKIQALENDDLGALPDAVFARALTSSVCRALKIDPTPILVLLPQGKTQLLPAHSAGVNAVFRDGSERSSAIGMVSRLSGPLGVAVVVLLIGAGVLAWMPSAWLQMNFGNTSASTASVIAPSSPAVSGELNAKNTAPIQFVDAAAPREISAAAQATTPPQAPVAAASSATIPEMTPSVPRLQLSTRGETWVQVKDAQGVVLLERILRAGENAAVNQPGRLSVVVGRADITEVYVAGEKLDIAAAARENVARFEVMP